ncbi:hypothetical protein GE09DRAFT_385166 [Coniochaeta sp. 2T2.1]|nr:hypothetical protein GE09DRAFT_385166 [Coniochaeta sp. 2T2.1]
MSIAPVLCPDSPVGGDDSIICTSSSVDTASHRHEATRFKPRPSECAVLNNYDGSLYTNSEIRAFSRILLPRKPLDCDRLQPAIHNSAGFMRVKVEEGMGFPPVEKIMEKSGVPRHAWINHWLFVHPDGRQAIGCDPLEYFSDWEDSEGRPKMRLMWRKMPTLKRALYMAMALSIRLTLRKTLRRTMFEVDNASCIRRSSPRWRQCSDKLLKKIQLPLAKT